MKIVYCHNYYRYRGGEDVSFECDLELLREEGHTVIPFTRENDNLGGGKTVLVAAQSIWNRQARREISALLEKEKPDLLHCNNLFPQISPSIYAAAKERNVPIVQAMRNYRNFCANSFFYRQGQICLKCLPHQASWHGLRYGCYRDSRLATAAVVAMQWFQNVRKIQEKHVTAFFAPTEFSRQVFLQGGFQKESFFLRSNFVAPDPGFSQQPRSAAICVGRLSQEKGFATVVQAWQTQNIEIPLLIIGDGPDSESLKQLAANNRWITFTGQLEIAQINQYLAGARVLIMPSLWYETFGRTIAEAFAQGVPVIASDLGAMAELVDHERNGFLFQPGNVPSLALTLDTFLNLGEQAEQQMRSQARETFQQRFTPQVSYQQLRKIYDYALQAKQRELRR